MDALATNVPSVIALALQTCSAAGAELSLEPFVAAAASCAATLQHACEQDGVHEDTEGASASDFRPRLISAFVILVASLVGVLPPLLAGRYDFSFQSPSMLLLKAFSAGIMLGLAQIHIITDSYADLEDRAGTLYNQYSIPGVFATIGVLFMFFTERLTLDYFDYQRSKAAATEGTVGDLEDEHAHGHLCLNALDAAHAALPQNAHHGHNHCAATLVLAAAGAEGAHAPQKKGDSAVLVVVPGGATMINGRNVYVTAYLLEFSILFHSLVIGLDIGVDAERPLAELITFCGVLCVHQFFEGIALGAYIAALKEVIIFRRQCTLALGFSVALPVGVGIGLGISQLWEAGSVTATWVLGAFNGLTGGMLLYMCLVVFMAEEFSRTSLQGRLGLRLKMYAMLCVGAAIMAIIGLWA